MTSVLNVLIVSPFECCFKKLVLSSPREAWAFYELKRYHTRPLRLNWGPENVHFKGPKYQCYNFYFFLTNIKNYQALLFYVLIFPLRYLKTAQKPVQSLKNTFLHFGDPI